MRPSTVTRLSKIEEVFAPRCRLVIIWDDNKPGCVERQTAAQCQGPHDQIICVKWREPA